MLRGLRRASRRRFLGLGTLLTAAVLAWPAGAAACGGLIGPNGAVNLLGTTTLAAYHDGVEHYITAFSFAGARANFGSIVPLPGVPTNVQRGGAWTLQRLENEYQSGCGCITGGGGGPDILFQTRIDALDVTVLRGGADEVGRWARNHGFRLPPDAPEVLDFYARRSPVFLAARFDADAARARGQRRGEGTPVHVTIPLENPWVPLRILALGKAAQEIVSADVYLLTDREPAILPHMDEGVFGDDMFLEASEPARPRLLNDLRSDRGMRWVPDEAWVTKVNVSADAGDLTYDLAVDASGRGRPDPVAAGVTPPETDAAVPSSPTDTSGRVPDWVLIATLAMILFGTAVAAPRVLLPRR